MQFALSVNTTQSTRVRSIPPSSAMHPPSDLRLHRVDLGPVKVSDATIRATLDGAGKLKGELRGLDASITLDPMVTGRGAMTLTPDGFCAALQASVLPLGGLGAQADVEVAASDSCRPVIGHRTRGTASAV